MHNKKFTAEIAHGVSSRNRITILARCVFPFVLDHLNGTITVLFHLATSWEGAN